MKTLLCLAVVLLCAGCKPRFNNATQTPSGTVTYNVVVIDGCQYLQFTLADLTHMGNCTNHAK